MRTTTVGIATVFAVALLFTNAVAVQQSAPSGPCEPALVFDISDEELLQPLGVVVDVAIGRDGIIYILDQQSFNVRRISPDGEELPALGRYGEGPGDLFNPSRLAVAPDGQCVVVQNMSTRAPCLAPDGKSCGFWDLSGAKKGFSNVVWTRAEFSPDGCLWLSGVNSRIAANPVPVGTVFRIGPGGTTELLMAQDADDEAAEVVRSPANMAFYANGWDLNDEGTLIYSHPNGSYGVILAQPQQEKTVVDLKESQGDEEKFSRTLETVPADQRNSILRVAAVQWLTPTLFIVKPAAEMSSERVNGSIGTWEVFEMDGNTRGRYVIHCDVKHSEDSYYLRRGMLLVLKGSRSVARAAYAAVRPELKNSESEEFIEEIRIVAYRLFPELISAH
jgi:hypothetical protein